MPEYLAPGVFIEEIERGPRPIEGVPTSTAAFLGETERGPIKPRLITSYKDYQRLYGRRIERDKFVPIAVNGFFENGGRRMYMCRIVGENATPADGDFGAFLVRASGAGSWGKRVFAKIEASTTRDGNNQPVGFRVRLAYFNEGDPTFDPFDSNNAGQVTRPSLVEDFDDLVVNEKSPDYYGKRLGLIDLSNPDVNVGPDSSALALLARKPNVPADAMPDFAGKFLDLAGVDDLQIDVADYVGDPSGVRREPQGLSALELDPYREVALVYAPNVGDDVALKIIGHCERMRFRFAVIDCPKGKNNSGDLEPRNLLETEYAAYYYPWIAISDPVTGAKRYVPPGGHALGVYARTDTERGVFKAPANEIVRGALDLEYDINDRSQEVLNPRGVNAIRRFPGRGIRIWGARTLTSNALWKYVSVRRLFIFIERSIYEGTQWVVFEPNDDRLWARVIDTIRLFLRTQWRNGALFGRTEAEAFFIVCDRTTMTQDDILNGRLICEIGIAPVRPAEFVIFRIFQHTAEAQR